MPFVNLICLTFQMISKHISSSPPLFHTHHPHTHTHTVYTHMSTPSSFSLVNLKALAVKAAGICYFVLFGIAASSHLIQTVSLGSLWHTGAEVAKELSPRCPQIGFLLQTSGVWNTEQPFPLVFECTFKKQVDPIAGSVEFLYSV